MSASQRDLIDDLEHDLAAAVERAERAEQERGEALNKLKAIRDERAKGRWVPYED